MGTRETAVSRSIEYETAMCTHCGDDLVVDSEKKDVDGLPEGVPVVLTGGENMTVDTTSITAAAKNYRIPKVVVKIFGLKSTDAVDQSYMCPACARAVYEFTPDQ